MGRQSRRGLAALGLGLLLVSCGEPVEPMSESEVRSIVMEVVSRHDTPRPGISFDSDDIVFKESSLAEAVCNTSTKRCDIVFQPCALSNRSIEELAVHEAAHVVVAWKHGLYDHGREWKRLMYEEGYSRANPKLHNAKC